MGYSPLQLRIGPKSYILRSVSQGGSILTRRDRTLIVTYVIEMLCHISQALSQTTMII